MLLSLLLFFYISYDFRLSYHLLSTFLFTILLSYRFSKLSIIVLSLSIDILILFCASIPNFPRSLFTTDDKLNSSAENIFVYSTILLIINPICSFAYLYIYLKSSYTTAVDTFTLSISLKSYFIINFIFYTYLSMVYYEVLAFVMIYANFLAEFRSNDS